MTGKDQTMKNDVAAKACTKAEAKALTERINSGIASLSADVFEAYERNAWKALGYSTWGAYVEGELEVSLRHSHRLIDLGKVEREIEAVTGGVTRVSHREADAIKDNLPQVAQEIRSRVESGEAPKKAAADVIAEQREAKAKAKAEREAQQAEWDRQQEDTRKKLPASIQAGELAKHQNGARHAAVAGRKPEPEETPEQVTAERDELREENAALKADVAERDKRLALFDDIAVQWEKGGFDAIKATLDDRIHALKRQVEDLSTERAQLAKSRDWWKKQALALGYVSPNSQDEAPPSDAIPADIAEALPF